jgi:hypothetical protein
MKAWLHMILTLGILAFALRTADAVPQWITGQPRGSVRVNDLQEAQQVSGLAIQIPPSIAASYRPREIVAVHPPAAGVAITLQPMAGGHGFSFFRLNSAKRAQQLLSPLPAFHEIKVQVAGRPARLRAVRAPDGTVTQELEWQGSLRTVVRFQGPTLELLSLGEKLAAVMP